MQQHFTKLGFVLLGLILSTGVFAQGDTLNYYSFAGEFEGWTATPEVGTDNWVISTQGATGAFSIGVITSTTAADGFLLFDSDLLCSGAQNAIVTSPILDFSQQTEVELRFQSLYRKFQDRVYVIVSVDSGATFVETEIYDDVAVNQPSGASLVTLEERVDISAVAAGQANVIVGFRFVGGCDYAWMIDDVAITNEVTPLPNVDLSLDANFAAFAPNFSTPASEADGQNIYFLTDVFNAGALAHDIDVAVSIFNASSELIYTDTLPYGSITPDSLAENKAFPQSFPLPTESGSYTGVYELLTDSLASDVTPDDNTIQFPFEISEGEFSKGIAATTGTAPFANELYDIGTVYYTPSLGQNRIFIDSITVGYILQGFGDNTTPSFILPVVYGYRGDLDGDGAPSIGDLSEADAELVELGIQEIEVPVGTTDGFYEFTLPADDGGSVELPLDENFIGFAVGLSVESTQGGGATEDVVFVAIDRNYNMSARDLAIDTLGVEEAYSSYFFVPNATGATSGFNFTGSAITFNAQIRTEPTVNVKELGTKKFALTPNPVASIMTVSIDLEETTAGAGTLVIRNAVGQEVHRQNRFFAAENVFEVDVTRYNNGLYYLEVVAADGSSGVKKFMVAK